MPQTIKCTSCNSENAEGLRFCITCGSRLGAPCPQCGAIVPPDSRFCPQCASLCGIGRFGKMQHKIEATQQITNCPDCGLPDNAGHRFCTACGAKLGIPCPQCSTIIEPAAGYCVNCGYVMEHLRGNKE